MINITQASSDEDLHGILELQKQNLAINLSPAEAQKEGFVTVVHSYEQLLSLNQQKQHIIAKEGERVVGYILAMTKTSSSLIPVLRPMFQLFDKIRYRGKSLAQHQYLVVGQVCISKGHRGTGIFSQCYAAYRDHYGEQYALAITEIAAANNRSLQAHRKVGFERIHHYTAPDGVAWEIVVWDWRA